MLLLLYLAGFLLWQDDHERWHKRYCRLMSQQKTLTIHESPSDDDEAISVISLVGAVFESDPPECDKDLSFGIRATPAETPCKLIASSIVYTL